MDRGGGWDIFRDEFLDCLAGECDFGFGEFETFVPCGTSVANSLGVEVWGGAELAHPMLFRTTQCANRCLKY